MTTKFFALVSVIGLATICIVQAQSPAPAESPAASPAKHRAHKKAEAAESPAAGTEASASAAESPAASPKAKRGRKAKTTAEVSPSPAGAAVAASPAAKRGRKTKTTSAAAVSPAPSPAKKTLADYFKPSASPAAAAAPAGTGATAGGAVVQATPARSGGNGLVWVNTETHVYHKEGSRFYGSTTHGKYVSEADAVKEGDRPAKTE